MTTTGGEWQIQGQMDLVQDFWDMGAQYGPDGGPANRC